MDQHPILRDGYSAIPQGRIATVVTCLQMLAPPATVDDIAPAMDLRIKQWQSPSIHAYRQLYRAVGEDWLWVSRLVMADEDLAAIIGHPHVEIYVLRQENESLGLLELDFRVEGECELAFFGLVPQAIGKGVGRLLMSHAIRTAWSRPIGRFWVHTCHLDSPQALTFYQRSGFVPYETLVEVMEDPRLTGTLPKTAAPHVPLIEPASAR
jgi:GNAT superfamily N-acetyltransferase